MQPQGNNNNKNVLKKRNLFRNEALLGDEIEI